MSLALQPLSLNPYSVITKDNADVQVSVTLNYLVSDPIKYFYNNTNSEESMSQLVRGHLRDIIGRMDLNQALGETSAINKELGDAVDDLTGIFGVKVVRINIDELDPSEEIQRAMDQQLTADRRKQAQILEAEGNARKIELEPWSVKLKLVVRLSKLLLMLKHIGSIIFKMRWQMLMIITLRIKVSMLLLVLLKGIMI